jgi:hypothetical protein
MGRLAFARQGWSTARGLRRLVRHPVSLTEAEQAVAREARGAGPRLLRLLDELVWPYPSSPTRRLLEAAGMQVDDVRRLVGDRGHVGALEALRDAGVYVSYEEYHGRVEARRGSSSLAFRPEDFFNPRVEADYIASTSGSRGGGGTPMELSFAWQRRQGAQRAIQYAMAGVAGAPTAVWLPVFPSAAGFGAVMKITAGGNRPERWFSQIPGRLEGVARRKQVANQLLPALSAFTRTGLPSPEHVPTDDPEPVVAWMQDALAREGRATITAYASSLTAAARWAHERGIDLTGIAAFPASEPVTAGKLAAMRAVGMRPYPMYAFVPEGTVAIGCDRCPDEEYHLWEHEVAVVPRRRPRGDGTDVDAFCITSLDLLAPRVLVNVENDDYGVVRRDVPCGCELGRLGLTTRLADIRGISKVVAAGITLEGEVFDEITEVVLPAAFGGGPGDYQFVEEDGPSGTTLTLRVHPDVGEIDPDRVLRAVQGVLATTDNGLLASSVWGPGGSLAVARLAPTATTAAKLLAYTRIGAGPA